MDTVFQALFSWQFVLFCLAISAIVFVLRQIAEYAMSNWSLAAKESKLWRDLILPILPIILGTVCAFFARKYPYPDGLTTISARVAFGLVAGSFSGLVYKVIKSILVSKLTSLVSSIGAGNINNSTITTQTQPQPTVSTSTTVTTDTTMNNNASVRNTTNNV